MVLSETTRESIKDVVSYNNLKELKSNNFLKDFENKQEFGNWSIIIKTVGPNKERHWLFSSNLEWGQTPGGS